MKFLKTVADFLAGLVTHIINPCIGNSYFLKIWKVARVSPIPQMEQSRITVLPDLSKLFERLFARHVTVCIENLALSNENVSAFRRNYSMTTAPLGIRDGNQLLYASRRGDFNGSRRRHLMRLILDKSKCIRRAFP